MPAVLTALAIGALEEAERAARGLGHEYVGTEHILLGLAKEGSGVANVLQTLDVDVRKIRLYLERVFQTGPGGDPVVLGRLPHTPRAKKVIEYSVEEARNLNHNYVGTEHLLLGLLREQQGVAAQVLMDLGLTLEQLREEAERHLPAPLAWRTADVVGVARGIVADRAFARLPVLADALMDAGCTDDGVLGHLRLGLAHGCRWPACWVIDRLLEPTAQRVSETTPLARKRWRFWA